MHSIIRKLGGRDMIYVITILVLVIMLIIKSCNSEKEVVVQTQNLYKYKTDTVYADNDYKGKYESLLKHYSRIAKVTPSKTVTIWKEGATKYVTLEKIPDSIVVHLDSLKQKLTISDKYLMNLPKNDKLVNFGLTQDSLNITTIDIDGVTKTKDYPLYLDKFGYQWYENELHHYNVKPKGKLKNKLTQLYINGGYDFYYKRPTIGAEYFIPIGKFKIGINSNLVIQPNTKPTLNLNLGYRIF